MDPLAFATTLALESGSMLMELLGTPLDIRGKATPVDLVTVADRRSEAHIVTALAREFPRATILGEESGLQAGSLDERWIVDPLDGTTNYAHGYPMFCISIAYEREGELEAGVVYAPALDLLFSARRGRGTTLNGSAVRVSTIDAAAQALVCTGFNPARYDRNGACFAAMSRVAQGVRRVGAAALDLAFVAAGRFDAFWEWDLKAWDKAAGTLLVREAGGAVTAISGGALDVDNGPILASNGRLHDEVVRILASAGEPPPV